MSWHYLLVEIGISSSSAKRKKGFNNEVLGLEERKLKLTPFGDEMKNGSE